MSLIQMYSLSTRHDGDWRVSIYPRIRDVKDAINEFCISMDTEVFTTREIREGIENDGDFKVEDGGVEIHVQEINGIHIHGFLRYYNLYRS